MGILYMLSIIDSIILGAVQGITEFLPISSSGHLIIARDILGMSQEGGLAFDAILQLATVCAVILYFRKDIWDLIVNVLKGFQDKEKNKLTIYLIVGTIPAVVLGLLLESRMETIFRSIHVVILTLVIGSVVMFIADKIFAKREVKSELTIKKSIIIGLFQSLALFPGMSRSGMSISGGYFMGLSKDLAVRFSFLLAVPIIFGSGLVKLIEIIQEPSLVSGGVSVLITGFISAFVFGWIAIDFLLKFLKTNTFTVFVVYRLLLVGVLLVLFVI